jgi:heme exporter protein A
MPWKPRLPTRLLAEGVAGARGGRVLFEGVSLDLRAGDAALVTGPNGAGKTTLLRILAGLLRPLAGRVVREGGVGWAGEALALDGERPLRDALGFWAGVDGAVPALAALGLEPLGQVPVRLMSTGQRRRAALARVVASGAGVWLLDEPANGLDVGAVAVLERLVAEHRGGGGCVVVASHQPVALPGAVEVRL